MSLFASWRASNFRMVERAGHPYLYPMQSQAQGRLSSMPAVDPDLILALQQLDDDGCPQASTRPAPRSSAFTVRDSTGEPRRDEHELGGEG